MSKNTENAKLVPLFGNTADNRAKLFVDELRNQFDGTTVAITKKSAVFENQYFKIQDGTAGDAIHSEWETFAQDLGARLQDKIVTDAAIRDIFKYAGTATPDAEQRFVQQLLKALFVSVSPSTARLDNVTTWSGVTDAKYKTAANLSDLFKGADVSTLKAKVSGASSGAGSKATEFGYRFDKFWLRTLLEAHAASATQSVGPSSFWNDEVQTAGQTYYRKGSELYMRDASGAEVRVDAGSPAFQSLDTAKKCLGTGFDISKGKSCADYLRDCLSGKDVMKCKAYLDNDDFWTDAVKEVDAMLPAMAVQTLNAFEFPMEQVWDNTANRRLLKYKSTDAWIAGLVELTKGRSGGSLAEPDVKKIAGNTKLIGYLNMLVKKVNSNPAILNKDYSGATDAGRINDPDAFVGSRLHKMGVKARLAAPTLSVSSIDKLANGIKDANARVSITLGYPGLYGYATKLNLMSGGGSVEDLETKVSDTTKHTSYIIQQHFAGLLLRLGKYGKQIEKSDSDKINKLIEDLKNAEEKLYKASLYTEKYAKLLEIHGQKDATSVLSMDHLKQFVDNRNKYFSRVAKKQNDLLSILRSIAEAANKEAPSTEAEMKAIDVDSKSVNFGALLG